MNNRNDLFSCRNISWAVLIVIGFFLMLWLDSFLWLIVAFILAAAAVIFVGINGIPMVCGDAGPAAEAPPRVTRQPAAAPPPKAEAPAKPAAAAPAPKAPAAKPEKKAPVAKAAEPEAPAAAPKKATASARPAPAPAGAAEDDLTRINGIGKVLAQGLKDNGVTTFAQIAAWGPAEIHWADNDLAKFKGRCTRDDWVGQARALAKG